MADGKNSPNFERDPISADVLALRLRTRAPDDEEAETPAKQELSRSAIQMIRPLPFFLGSLASLAILQSCADSSDALPHALIGHWVADDNRYEGRDLIVTEQGNLIFRQDGTTTHSGVIDEVLLVPSDTGKQGVRLTYSDSENIEFQTMIILDAEQGSFVFDNSKTVHWHRDEVDK